MPLVAFNAHLVAGDASYRSAGIYAYIVNVLRNLPSALADLRWATLLGQGRLPEDITLPVVRSRFPTARPWARILWEQTGLPLTLRRLDAALLHAPAFVGPLWSPCPQVITVHDVSFMRYPHLFRRGNRLYLKTMTGAACRRAAAVIAVSQFTANEVSALLRVPAARVHVIPNGVAARFRPLPLESVARFRQEKQLPERFILSMGTLEPRKNLLTLVRAFARLALPDVQLVLAGGKGWLYADLFAEIERLGLRDRVLLPGYVPAEEQPLWYNTAAAFAYISHYEGFGLPALEALACGTPTLISTAEALVEVAQDAALAVPGEDVPAVADGLRRVLEEPSLRASLRERGLARAARFTWAETARQTAALYQHLLSGQGEVA